jgi:hypothetical protein
MSKALMPVTKAQSETRAESPGESMIAKANANSTNASVKRPLVQLFVASSNENSVEFSGVSRETSNFWV